MGKKKKALLAVVAVAVLALGTLVFVNRGKTRLRLAYPPGEVSVTRDLVYVAGSSNPKHRLDVYAPKDARGAPVVLFIHGGYWIEGDKDFYAAATGLYGSIGQALARRGVVTVVQSYRLAPEVAIDGILDDVMAGLRWTEANATAHGGDPRRVFVMGHSAGGHLTALIGSDDALHTKRGLDPRGVRGYIVLSGVWDIAPMKESLGPELNAKITYAVFGQDPAAWSERSPITKLHAGMAPFLIVTGENDYDYMIPQAARADERLAAVGSPHEKIVLPATNHRGVVLTFGTSDDLLSDRVADFVTRP